MAQSVKQKQTSKREYFIQHFAATNQVKCDDKREIWENIFMFPYRTIPKSFHRLQPRFWLCKRNFRSGVVQRSWALKSMLSPRWWCRGKRFRNARYYSIPCRYVPKKRQLEDKRWLYKSVLPRSLLFVRSLVALLTWLVQNWPQARHFLKQLRRFRC